MLAIISKEYILKDALRYYLIEGEKSLLKQSEFNKERLQEDGWGFGYYSDVGKPVIFKSQYPVFKEKDLFEKKVESIKTRIAIFHIRAASNPRNLDRKKLLGIENTQPFTYKNFIFAHNGTLSIVDDIYENLGRYKKYVKGINDSEVLFWNLIKHIDAYGDIPVALSMLRDEIKTVWVSVKRNYSFELPYKGINIFLSDSNKLYAMCDFKMKDEKYSIMSKGWEYGRFAYRNENGLFVIASEPVDNKNWNKSNHLSIISVDKEINMKITEIEE